MKTIMKKCLNDIFKAQNQASGKYQFYRERERERDLIPHKTHFPKLQPQNAAKSKQLRNKAKKMDFLSQKTKATG